VINEIYFIFIGTSLSEPHTSGRAVSHRPSHGNLRSNTKNCPLQGKFTIKHKKQTLQIKFTVKLNGVDCCTSLFGVSYRQFHSEVNGIDYCASLFGVSHRPLHKVKQGRLLHVLH